MTDRLSCNPWSEGDAGGYTRAVLRGSLLPMAKHRLCSVFQLLVELARERARQFFPRLLNVPSRFRSRCETPDSGELWR
jgi:hypothetical protein